MSPTDETSAMPDRADRPARVPWGAVVLYIVVAFGLAWLVALPLWTMDRTGPVFATVFGVLSSAVMFTPGIAVLVVTLALRTPRTERLRFLGMWPLRPAKRVVWGIVGALVGVPLLVVLALAVAALFGWLTLDLAHFSGFAETLHAQLPQGTSGAALPPTGLLVALQFVAIPLGALFNCIFAFGEEVGWRGWLLPALRPLGVWPALILSGAVWGLWHSPVILLGHNFGLTDWRGVALMTVGCIALGMVLGWLRLRTASVWPAVMAHGAFNAAAGLYGLVYAAGTVPNAALVNPLGVSGWIACALVVLILALTGQFRKEPELARRRPVVSRA